jgi:hypothetical protein
VPGSPCCNPSSLTVSVALQTARVVPDVLRGAFKKHEGFRAVLPFVGTTATVYIGLQAWSFWEDQFLCLVEQGEVRAEAVIEAPGGYSGEGPLPITHAPCCHDHKIVYPVSCSKAMLARGGTVLSIQATAVLYST